MRSGVKLAACLAMALSCGPSGSPSAPAELTPGTIAVAGALTIETTVVVDVVKQTNQSARQAVDALIFDAVLAQGATARKLDQRSDVHEAQRAIRARFVTDRIESGAVAMGPATDAEVALMTARHWRDVDLPEQARVVHVVVMSETDPIKRKRARTVAEDLRNAVLGARDSADFLQRAKQVDAQGLRVQPETLPLFVADGRVVEGNGELDKVFCGAAFALSSGETSAVVETVFGLHVIRMLERLPAKHVPLEERRIQFTNEVTAQRGHDAYVALLADLKRKHPVIEAPAADALMASAIVP